MVSSDSSKVGGYVPRDTTATVNMGVVEEVDDDDCNSMASNRSSGGESLSTGTLVVMVGEEKRASEKHRCSL